MEFEEKTIKSEYLYKGKIINLRKDEIVLEDGKKALREIVEHSGGCAVLCEKDGCVLMVKQFRYPYKETVLEIPAGKINVGESPYETAIRELEEEGGIKAEKVSLMYESYPSPGYTNEKIYIYKAENFVKSKQNLDEDEFLTAEWIKKDKLKDMIKNGEIKDGKTLIALLSIIDVNR